MAYLGRGNVYNALGSHDLAINDYTRSVSLPGMSTADLANAYYGRGNAHYGRGIARYAAGEYDLAFSDYNRAIALAPNLAVAYLGRGNVYYSTSRYELASRDYSKGSAMGGDVKCTGLVAGPMCLGPLGSGPWASVAEYFAQLLGQAETAMFDPQQIRVLANDLSIGPICNGPLGDAPCALVQHIS